MIIVKLQGGLGNQMFQYAFGKFLAHKHQTELKLDLSFLLARPKVKNEAVVFRDYDLAIFDIDESFATENEVYHLKKRTNNPVFEKLLNKLLGFKKSYVVEPYFHFSKEIAESNDNVYLEGYWQTEKYFKPISDIIKSKFTVKENLLPQSAILAAEIDEKKSICLNVRRGDFTVNPYHGTLPVEYYIRAEEIILKHMSDPHFYVFSDDLQWCHENLNLKSKTTFVSHEYAGKKFQDYLRLMSYCKHFIIPNSSFGWWAAYLGNYSQKIVITPNKWVNDDKVNLNDLFPDGWIKIVV